MTMLQETAFQSDGTQAPISRAQEELDRLARREVDLTAEGRTANEYGPAVLKDIISRFIAGKREARMDELLCDALGMPWTDFRYSMYRHIGAVMKALGWRRIKRRSGSYRYWAYVPIPRRTPEPSSEGPSP